MSKSFRKFRSRAGESIAETLVALLVGCLALTMLAGMITTTSNLVNKSRNVMNEYYTDENDMARLLEDAQVKSNGNPIKITVKIADSGGNTLLSNDAFVYQGGTDSRPIYAYHK